MNATTRVIVAILALPPVLALALLEFPAPVAQAGPKPETYWQVDDVRAGMKGG